MNDQQTPFFLPYRLPILSLKSSLSCMLLSIVSLCLLIISSRSNPRLMVSMLSKIDRGIWLFPRMAPIRCLESKPPFFVRRSSNWGSSSREAAEFSVK